MIRIYVYIIRFPTSKKLYIGQTIDLKRRLLYQHLNSDSLVGRALNKYDDWQIFKLHTCKTRDEANRIEIEEIRNFNSIHPNGYNVTRGGSDSNGFEGYHHTEESISKMIHPGNQFAKGHKPSKESIEKMIHPGNQNVKGKHWTLSEEAKKNQSEAKKGTTWEVCEEGRKNMSASKIRNQNAKGKNLGKNNCAHRTDVKYKCLRTRLENLLKEA